MSAHVTDRLSAYLDGALGASDLGRVEAHLEVCPGCQREYREIRRLQALLRGLPEPAVPAGLGERVRWRLAREANRPARRDVFGWLSVAPLRLALACAAVLLVLGLPLGWVAGRLMTREAPLDTDVYLRDYLVLSVDRPLGDDAAATFLSPDTAAPAQPGR